MDETREIERLLRIERRPIERSSEREASHSNAEYRFVARYSDGTEGPMMVSYHRPDALRALEFLRDWGIPSDGVEVPEAVRVHLEIAVIPHPSLDGQVAIEGKILRLDGAVPGPAEKFLQRFGSTVPDLPEAIKQGKADVEKMLRRRCESSGYAVEGMTEV